MTTGWKLDRDGRANLLEDHPARYTRVVADHVTFAAPVDDPGPAGRLPPAPRAARIVGRADDGEGVEAMVVEIDGATARPDGGTWHVTWSLGEGREAKESNDVIAAHGWTRVAGPPLELIPARW